MITYANDRRNDLDGKLRDLEKRGEEVVQEIDQQSFDMRSVADPGILPDVNEMLDYFTEHMMYSPDPT